MVICRLHCMRSCCQTMPSVMCLHAHLAKHPHPIELPVQLAKKELEGALSVDGVEATLLRVRFQITVACIHSIPVLGSAHNAWCTA